MIRNSILTTSLMVATAALGSSAASAQVRETVNAISKTDVAVSLYGAFNGTTNGNGTTQSPANAAGGLIEVRHIVNPIIGYEGTYSFNRANQTYSQNSYAVCGVCSLTAATTPVSADAHQVTGNWVASLEFANLRPFALAGGGILFNQPSNGQSTTTTIVTGCGGGNPNCTPGSSTTSTTPTASSTKGVFDYGAGLDWGPLPHLGLRFQYRGNLYKAPDLAKLYTSTGAFTHTSEPMIGVYFRL